MLCAASFYVEHDGSTLSAASLNGTLPGGTLPASTSVRLSVGAQGGPFKGGSTVIFELSVENLTGEDIHNVSVDVTVPEFSTFDTNNSSPDWQLLVLERALDGSAATCPDNALPGTTCRFEIGTLPARTTTLRGVSQDIAYAVQLEENLPKTLRKINLSVRVNGAELSESLNVTEEFELVQYLLLPVVLNR